MNRNDCSITQDLLPLYIEDMLRPDTAAFVEDHLSGCKTCAAALGDLKAETAPASLPDAEEARKGDKQVLKGLKKSLTLRNCIISLAVTIIILHFIPWSPLPRIYQGGSEFGVGLHYLVLLTGPSFFPLLYFAFHPPKHFIARFSATLLCIPLLIAAVWPMFGGLRKLFYPYYNQTFETLLPVYWLFLFLVLLFSLLTTLAILKRNVDKK